MVGVVRSSKMSVRIKAVVDRFVKELKEALDADIQDRVMKEREMQSYIAEREREVAEREAAWKAELSRREVRNPQIQSMAPVPSSPVTMISILHYLFLDQVWDKLGCRLRLTAGCAFPRNCICDLI